MPEPIYSKNLDDFRAALSRFPERAYGIYGLSLLYSLKPDEVAREKVRLGVQPKDPRDFYNLGVLASREERYDEALKMYQKSAELEGDFPELYYNMGLAYERLKQVSKAVDSYTRYAELARKDESEETRNEIRLVKNHIRELKG